MAGEPRRHETYTHGHAPATVRQHGRRTAEEAAAFLLPSLKAGMRLLDVGCGPGSITRGLAERLAPGEVVGVDLSRETLAQARADAAARGLTNLTYEEASVTLAEMLRVVRPGGVVGVRDVHWATVAYWPEDLWIDRFIEVHFKTWYRNGGQPRMGRRLRALFNAAGVDDLEISADVWCYAMPAETTAWGDSYAERLLTSPMGARPVEYGFATREDIEAMAAAFRARAGHPDAFGAFTQVAALARKPA